MIVEWWKRRKYVLEFMGTFEEEEEEVDAGF